MLLFGVRFCACCAAGLEDRCGCCIWCNGGRIGDDGARTFSLEEDIGDAGNAEARFLLLLLLLALLLRVGSKFKNVERVSGDDGGAVPSSIPRLTLLLPVEIDVVSADPHPICLGCSHAGIPLILHSIFLLYITCNNLLGTTRKHTFSKTF